MSNLNNYTLYKERKNVLVDLIRESSSIVNDISLTQYAEGLEQLGKRVENESFKIQIVGTFKNGKSTFINALLGEDILPTKSLPCTAVINEVKYGDAKKAILNFRNPLPETLLSDIPAATLAHMQAHGMKDIPPMEIEYDRISDYVTIPVNGDPEEISYMSPYLSVELFYPSPLLKEGVEIIDSPGLNENDERTAVTLGYLDKADAIIFLLDATHACAKDEMETIEDILVPKGFDDMFFVVNRFDIPPKREREDIKQYVENKVKKYTTNDIYCISALNALDGKVEQDNEKLAGSGFMEFEKKLSEFLTKDKGKIKLTRPAKELKNILANEALFKAIPFQRKELSTNIHILKERYESVKPELIRYESQKDALQKDLELKIEKKENNISKAITAQFRETANMVPTWIATYEPKNRTGIFAKKSQVDKVAAEIKEHISFKVKEHFGKWNKDVLVPLVEESAIEIFESSDNKLKEILDGIDQLQSEITGNPTVADTSSGWARVIGAAGICCGYVSGASLLSGQFDIKALAKSLAIDLGVGAGLYLLGITNPILAIAAVVLVIWKSVIAGQGAVIKRLKNELTPQIRNSIIDSAASKSEEIVKKIDEEFKQSVDIAIKAIDLKINNLKSQIEAVLKEKEEGEESASKRIKLLDHSEKQLQKICSNLDDFVIGLVEMK